MEAKLKERLELANRASAARRARVEAWLAGADPAPRVGDLYVPRSPTAVNLRWLVVEAAAARCLLLPADDHRRVGPRDLRAPAGLDSEAVTVRGAYGVEAPTARLTPDLRVGFLDAEFAARAREAARAASPPPAPDDPDFARWLACVAEARDALAVHLRSRAVEPRREAPPAPAQAPLAASSGGLLGDVADALDRAARGVVPTWRVPSTFEGEILLVGREDGVEVLCTTRGDARPPAVVGLSRQGVRREARWVAHPGGAAFKSARPFPWHGGRVTLHVEVDGGLEVSVAW